LAKIVGASPHVTADHADVHVWKTAWKLLQLSDHLWKVLSQCLLLGIHRRGVVDHEQDVDHPLWADQNLEVGFLLRIRRRLLESM
jgi:hypothetical protein